MRLDARPASLRFLVSPLRERRLGLAVLAAALLIIGGLWWIWAIDHRPMFAAPRVAVLPFDNLSADAANGRIADGITERPHARCVKRRVFGSSSQLFMTFKMSLGCGL